MTRRDLLLLASGVPAAALAGAGAARDAAREPRLKSAFRKSEQKGWIVVHLEGSPSEIGFQHGALLANEILDTHRAISLGLTHDIQEQRSLLISGNGDTDVTFLGEGRRARRT